MNKIIHIDMDCFYAAIEIRDNPDLRDKPVAVGGQPDRRGVLCTCNYLARKFGVRSAMATSMAYRLCPDLVVLPVNMPKYKEVARRLQAIFRGYTELVEPLALDEAYLDVTTASHHQGIATYIAEEIRQRIFKEEQLAASAGVAPNKFLAKIASGWKKPNGLFVIRPHQVESFVKTLAVDEIFGVGKVTAAKLHRLGLKTCADLQKLSLAQMTDQFGKLGQNLYDYSRGIDNRAVEPNRPRKSLSVERTFLEDINSLPVGLAIIEDLHQELVRRIQDAAPDRIIKNQYIKIKFHDFKLASAETVSTAADLSSYLTLFRTLYGNETRPIRLLGVGVHFHNDKAAKCFIQQELF